MRRTPVVAVIGASNSGKTLLMVKIIRRLSSQGYRVATIKHCAHGLDGPLDKDSARHFCAGSLACVAVSAKELVLQRRLGKSVRLERMVREHFLGMDLVLAEGFKNEKVPKIEVLRKAVSSNPVSSCRDRNLLALVSDVPVKGYSQPRFLPHQVKEIVAFIKKEFL